MDTATRATTPWHLWLVGVFALLFTLYGGYDYYMSQTGNREYIEAAMGGMGADVDAAAAYFSTFPLWLDLFWAIGVWGAVAASVLLLLRSRYAYPLFVVSLIGFIVSNLYGFVNPLPGMEDSSQIYIVVTVVFVVMVLITLYARNMVARGVLT